MTVGTGTALLIGGGTLVAGVFAGKLVVDAVQGEVEGRGHPLDESVRFVGSLLGVTLALLQLPKAYEAAQSIVSGESPF